MAILPRPSDHLPIPKGAMTNPTPTKDSPDRVRISCPGCGRHDWVTWPAGQDAYHWKCFNCLKEFDLHKGSKH